MELVLAGIVGRRTSYLTAIAAIAAGVLLLWPGEFLGFLIGGLPAGGAAYLALATVSVAAVFVGVGALASQLAPTRRLALELGGAVLALMFLLRVIADTAGGAGWLRWAHAAGVGRATAPVRGPAAARAAAAGRRDVPPARAQRADRARGGTSAPAHCRAVTAPRRVSGCSPRRPRRRSASSAPACSCGRAASACSR